MITSLDVERVHCVDYRKQIESRLMVYEYYKPVLCQFIHRVCGYVSVG
jgi:hypothetical protein